MLLIVKKDNLLKYHKDDLRANAIQMSHHGQNGVTKDVYDAISPEVCFYNCPEWLWNNDNGERKFRTLEKFNC